MENNRFVFFLHIPKTAGTSFTTILKIQYPVRKRYSWDNVKWQNKILEFKSEKPNSFEKATTNILKGHYYFGLHKYIQRPFVYTTILREPISRAVSHFKQLYKMNNSQLQNSVDRNGILFALKKYDNYAFRNIQSRWIAGIELDQQIDDDKLLALAIHNFEIYFPVFGLVEKFDESVLLMKKAFNWKYPPVYSILNTSVDKGVYPKFGKTEMTFLKNMNEVDIKFYEFARQRFEEINNISSLELKMFRLKKEIFQYVHSIYLEVKKVYDYKANASFLMLLI